MLRISEIKLPLSALPAGEFDADTHPEAALRAQIAQTLAIDYAVYHVRANGGTSVKVFKGWALTLAPCETRLLDKRHSLRPVTTRRQHPGPHRIDLRINGQVAASAAFELQG